MTKEELFEKIWADMLEEIKSATQDTKEKGEVFFKFEGDITDALPLATDYNFAAGYQAGLIRTLSVLMNHYKESRDL